MDLATAYAYCISLPHVEETTPFGPDVLVFKVADKMFALTSPDDFPPTMNLKCDPERALELRDSYPAVKPGYHMNKRHWNTVTLDGSIPDSLILEMIRHSYDLVVSKLSKAKRAELGLI